MKKQRSTPDEFVNAARKEFGYLVKDFGFEEDLEKRKFMTPRTVCYSSPVAAVTVEGIQTTMNVMVTLTCLAPDGQEPVRLPLSTIVDQRAPEARMFAQDLLEQVAHDAGLLKRHATDLLRGGEQALTEARRMAETQRLQEIQQKAGKRAVS